MFRRIRSDQPLSPFTLISIIATICFALLLLYVRDHPSGPQSAQENSLHQLYRDIGLVFVTLLITILRERYNRPYFKIISSDKKPFQILWTDVSNDRPVQLQYVRLKIQNVGSASEGKCEVRIEKIVQIARSGKLEDVVMEDHDPRPLKWVGRDTCPIALGVGAFDFVDLGIRRPTNPHHFLLDFVDRGFCDIQLNDQIKAFRVEGHVYGEKAQPLSFAFELTWDLRGDFRPINIKEI